MTAIKIIMIDYNKTILFTTNTTKSTQKILQDLYKDLLKEKIDTTILVHSGNYANELIDTIKTYYKDIEIIEDIKISTIKKYCKDSINR